MYGQIPQGAKGLNVVSISMDLIASVGGGKVVGFMVMGAKFGRFVDNRAGLSWLAR